MDKEQRDQLYVRIHFDGGESVRLKKSFLTKKSLYFDAMLGGNFMESQSGDKIQLQGVDYTHFMSIIHSLRHNTVVIDGVDELLRFLETSIFYQFTDIIKKSNTIIKESMLTCHAIPILLSASRLALSELCEKARIYILYNFKTLLANNREQFYQLNRANLLLLFNDNGLNVNDEMDVFNLVIEWCSKNYDIEYEMVSKCVRFNLMDANQLNNCISKTKNSNLQNTIKQYIDYNIQGNESMKPLIRPIRNVPNVLCTVKNDDDGDAHIWKWDWQTLQFSKFLKVDPLPSNTVGYHVMVKDMEIYVMGGEIGYFRGIWNESGWKYSLLSKEWIKLENFVPSKRRNGIGYFCGDDLFLIGGRTKHRLRNKVMEHFRLDKDNNTLVHIGNNECFTWGKEIMSGKYICLEYQGQFVMIKKYFSTKWHSFSFDESNPSNYKWDVNVMNIEPIITSATVYLDSVYILVSYKKTIGLHCYSPEENRYRTITIFNIEFEDGVMCAFNDNKAMVFKNNTLSYYLLDTNVHKECTLQDNFYSEHFFIVPIY
ncbi:BTB/POZ domain,SKP1/BTB/POZ domain,Kelch-type beta propeller,BTB/Kelch-associated [Cinara cedri]|uniref:BTB/POZ domain,SKP1/BTB/POZ domain,Kelch-type beta propeller,BTB/Kelch-associated n=1 Tax=Cinara cedri TaxID=506608 RepID=A0A5E4NS69_9HEMI|nr:BTB/POZ domain,SKP1/BTB/POZ domain,Kelch-type beta propeller,BTB/Kelch-associated [Cinara cedri]